MANTVKTTTGLPSYIENPTKTALTDVQSWLKSDKNYVYGSKKGEELTTDLSQYQKDAMGNVGWLANQDLGKMFGLDKAGELWDQYASAGPSKITGGYDAGGINETPWLSGISGDYDTAGIGGTFNSGAMTGDYSGGSVGRPQAVGTERLVDENGWLGKISDYTNPYTQATLDPVLRELRQEDQRQKNNIGSLATQSGAFGDARHGIMEGEQSSRTNEAISDSTSKAYSDAYNSAMAQRSSDIGRKGEMDVGNVNRDLQAALANLSSFNEGQGRALSRDSSNQQNDQGNQNRSLQLATTNLDNANLNSNRRLDVSKTNLNNENMNADRSLDVRKTNLQSANNTQDRLLNRDTLNRNAEEAAVERLGTAATAAEGLGNNLYSKFTNVNDALYNAGTIAQQTEEKKRAAKEAYVRAVNEKRYNDAIKLLSVVQGSPQGTTQTQSKESDDGKLGVIGSLIGGLFG